MKHEGEPISIRFALICALFVFSLIACSFFESVFGPPEPVMGTINPTFVSVMKNTEATHDTLGSLVKIKLNGAIVNGDEVSLLVSVDSKAQQADLVVEVPAINGRPVRLIDRTGAAGEKLPLLSGQQVITATFPKPGNSKDWTVMITVSNVNGVEGNFGWPLPIEPYFK